MWKRVAETIDRFAIRSACGSVRPSPDGQTHAEEAGQFLARSDFFAPQIVTPDVRVKKGTLEFDSPFANGPSPNNLVRGRFYPARDWQRSPSVILLHGWNGELQYRWQFPFLGELLALNGINAVMFELPFHASRKPAAPAIRNFLSGNLLHVAQATHQALADVRGLVRWLIESGSPAVAVWGTSLGGWLAGLTATHQPECHSAILLTPVARMDRALRELAFCEPIRKEVLPFTDAFAPLNLISHPLRIEAKRVLIVASQYDLLAPQDTLDELEAFWRPEVWRFPHGHISILMATSIMRRIVRWLREQLLADQPQSFARQP